MSRAGFASELLVQNQGTKATIKMGYIQHQSFHFGESRVYPIIYVSVRVYIYICIRIRRYSHMCIHTGIHICVEILQVG